MFSVSQVGEFGLKIRDSGEGVIVLCECVKLNVMLGLRLWI